MAKRKPNADTTEPDQTLRGTVERILAAYQRHQADPVARAVTESTLQTLAVNLGLLDVAAELPASARAALTRNAHRALTDATPAGYRSITPDMVRSMVRPVMEALLHAEYLRAPQTDADRFDVPDDWELSLASSLLRDLAPIHLSFVKIEPRRIVPILARPKTQQRAAVTALLELLPGVRKPSDVPEYVKEALRKPRNRDRG